VALAASDSSATLEDTPTRKGAPAGAEEGSVLEPGHDRLEVFGTAAHDLRNPLTVILSLTELMLHEQSLGPDEVQQFLEAIRTNADEMHQLLDDVQEIARLERRRDHVNRTGVPVATLLADAVAESGLTGSVAIEVAPELDEWPLDQARMRRALCLLVADAASRSATGTSISATLDGDELSIEVRDDGPLLAPDALQELGDSLRRGRRRKGEIAVGTGLGPALAARIIEAHGGTVVVAATPPRGTSLRVVRIPRA
jgi:two-component system, OmpR family, sensor histidine kinase KdpD